MTSITPEYLLAELRRAADVVTGIAASLDDAAVAAPSELPGWTRGHVLAHVTGIANAMARQVEYSTRGERIELYDGGFEGRNRAIELAAGHGAEQHRAAVGAAIDRALAAFGSLDEEGWQAPITFRDGVVFDGGLALWRELTIHATDLGTGRGPETWSRPFCEHLFEFLAARVPEGERFVLQPLGLPSVALGAAGGRSTVINGMLTDIAAWLAGRTPTLGSLRATAAADGVELPALLPWPAGVPVTK
ncbi:maleylpyruvate isomerase family mycothiol-dependent enzyme [Arthrobacter sp. KBS0702]|uniref:maleylpyruvate isomerase family mycothiol-dependent enzyme n=1 Tax=Arthrobacter sp. KBS0702 TaxID=2578107 RepID=UPI00110F4626|nr:maleylpyruvate isomerase family mycothiol-dependent enzyme [Arthrobacter sp. KBS0702]QDW29397.1 maleylpyruvate isomerase family mycothiol-dependent enzyme [Arthrobacter sp. KBS0702]